LLELGLAKAKTTKKIIRERIKRRMRFLIFIALKVLFSKDFKNIKEENSIFLTLCLLKRWIKTGRAIAKRAQRKVGLRKLNIIILPA
ncbi:MAG: hypothetical protein MUO78_10575, partial [candidate division Zixibacteria bacterium]|nr:hypothetical protein [candidate division Zixibacteria bacterium]